MCASTYVNGRRRKFFEKNFRALSRLDDAKEKSKITAPPRAGSLAVCQDVAIANHASIEKKGLRRNPDDLNLIATGNSEKTISALAERMHEGQNDRGNKHDFVLRHFVIPGFLDVRKKQTI